MHLRQHFHETKELLEEVSAADVASWLLQQGYFPERYVLPPSFQVSDFKLQPKPYYNDLSGLSRRKIETISYPKTLLTDRRFGVIHPWNYHDIVFYLYGEWTTIINHLFHEDQRIYSYSLPIPVTKEKRGRVGNLRASRMIYEWLTMAEKDLILDAGKYQ